MEVRAKEYFDKNLINGEELSMDVFKEYLESLKSFTNPYLISTKNYFSELTNLQGDIQIPISYNTNKRYLDHEEKLYLKSSKYLSITNLELEYLENKLVLRNLDFVEANPLYINTFFNDLVNPELFTNKLNNSDILEIEITTKLTNSQGSSIDNTILFSELPYNTTLISNVTEDIYSIEVTIDKLITKEYSITTYFNLVETPKIYGIGEVPVGGEIPIGGEITSTSDEAYLPEETIFLLKEDSLDLSRRSYWGLNSYFLAKTNSPEVYVDYTSYLEYLQSKGSSTSIKLLNNEFYIPYDIIDNLFIKDIASLSTKVNLSNIFKVYIEFLVKETSNESVNSLDIDYDPSYVSLNNIPPAQY